MWLLEVSLVQAVTRVSFTDKAKALAEQEKLQALMGLDIYERNREKSERTYKIEGEHETCVVSLQSVQAVSVVDPVEFAKSQEPTIDYKEEKRRLAFRSDCATMAEYGIKAV